MADDEAKPSIWQEFCTITSVHGFLRVGLQQKTRLYRIIWWLIIGAAVATSSFMISGISIASLVLLNPYSNLRIDTNYSLAYPNFIICDSTFFSRTRLEGMGFNRSMGNYLIGTMSQLLLADTFRRNATLARQYGRDLDNLLKPLGGRLQPVLDEAALSCEEIVMGCIKSDRRITGAECCAKYFSRKKLLNAMGSCVTTAGQETIVETMPISLSGWTVLVKMNTDNIVLDSTIITPWLTEKKGIPFALSHPSVFSYASLMTDVNYVQPGTAAVINLIMTKTDNSAMKGASLAPYDCAYPDEISKYGPLIPGFKAYTQANCKLAVAQQKYQNWYNCSVISIPTELQNLRYCQPRDFLARNKDDTSEFYDEMKIEILKCVRDCISTFYSPHINNALLYLDEESLSGYGISRNHDTSKMASLHFYFRSLDYNSLINQPESLFKWISDMGGILGLFLGASLISICEVLEVVSLWLYGVIKENHLKNKTKNETINDEMPTP